MTIEALLPHGLSALRLSRGSLLGLFFVQKFEDRFPPRGFGFILRQLLVTPNVLGADETAHALAHLTLHRS
jgi:hypothetical protein